jgi:hypothetical protein
MRKRNHGAGAASARATRASVIIETTERLEDELLY